MKKALLVVGIILVLIAVAVVWVLGSLDDIVKKQIEVVGTELTGTNVSVGGVNIELTDGSGRITGLSVANPKGYQADHAFKMKLLHLDIDLPSVGKNPLIIKELVIDAPAVNMEVNEKGGSNLKEISDNVSANTAAADKQATKTQEKTEGEALRILIRKLVIKDVGYSVHSKIEKIEDREGVLPTITLNNVGGSKGGTPGEIGKIVIGELARRVIKEAAARGIRKAVEDKVDEATGGLGGMLKKLGE